MASIVLEVQFLAFRHNSTATSKSARPPLPLFETSGAPTGDELPTARVAAVDGKQERKGPPTTGAEQPAAALAPRAPASRRALLALAVGSSAASALGVVGLLYLYRLSPSWFADAMGSALSSILIAAGFVPQIALMCKKRSSQGFSLGLSALDSVGSCLSIAALLLAPLARPGAAIDWGEIVPYAVIVGFQVGRTAVCN